VRAVDEDSGGVGQSHVRLNPPARELIPPAQTYEAPLAAQPRNPLRVRG
jgi:hypothetical protein